MEPMGHYAGVGSVFACMQSVAFLLVFSSSLDYYWSWVWLVVMDRQVGYIGVVFYSGI